MMYYIEDIVYQLFDFPFLGKNTLSQWEYDFLSDISMKISQEKTLSTKQVEVVIKILKRESSSVAKKLNIKEETLLFSLEYPKYRRQPYESIYIPREARYIGNRKLAFSSKYNPELTKDIKSCNINKTGKYDKKVFFDYDHKLWIVEINNRNLAKIKDIIKEYDFNVNEELVEFLENCENAKERENEYKLNNQKIDVVSNNDEILEDLLEFFEDMVDFGHV